MKNWGVALVVGAALGGIAIWHWWPRKINPLVTGDRNVSGTITQNVGNFDQFQQDLAARVLKQFGADTGSDFSVIVATTAYPLGTLLRATGSVPAGSRRLRTCSTSKALHSSTPLSFLHNVERHGIDRQPRITRT